MHLSSRKVEKLIVIAIYLGFILWSAAFIWRSSFTVDGKRYFSLFDDAMISMRYAWNFSHGLGLVWNAGDYVQGYTNLLMTLFMSIGTLLFDKSTAVLFVQIFGVIFMLISGFLSMNIADQVIKETSHQTKSIIRILALLCTFLYYPLTYWSLMGMETGLLTVLLLLGVLFALKYSEGLDKKYLYFSTVSLALAYLTRNDSIIFSFLIALYILWEILNKRAGRKNIYHLIGAMALFLLVVIGQSLFQYLYYGEFLPNTYTLKLVGMPFKYRILNGRNFVSLFLQESVIVLIVSTLGFFFGLRKKGLLLYSIVLSSIAYQIYVGGDPWDYWRIMSPTIPLLFVLFLCTADAILSASTNIQALTDYLISKQKSSVIPFMNNLLVILIFLIGIYSVNARFLSEMVMKDKPYQADANKSNVYVALAIDQITTKDASLGVFWAGALPYYSDRKAIDFLGKSDKYIASLPPDMSGSVGWNGIGSVPGHNKYDLIYSIIKLKPTYVEDVKWGLQDLTDWARTNYVPVHYKGVDLLLLKDSPDVLWEKVK